MNKIFITGANGFLGQHLCLFLASNGHTVIASGRGACRIPSREKFEYAELDITDKEAVQHCLQWHPTARCTALSKPIRKSDR